VWSPPGQTADPSSWRLDITRPRKGKGGSAWLPPGSPADAANTQYSLPSGASPSSSSGGSDWSLRADPPGSTAPVNLPNWTPGNKRMSPPGEMADPSKLNLTAVPNWPSTPPPPQTAPAPPSPATPAPAPLPPQGGGMSGVGAGQDDNPWSMGGNLQQSDIWSPSSAVGAGQAAPTDTTTGTSAGGSGGPGPLPQGALPIPNPDDPSQIIGYYLEVPDSANPGQFKVDVHWTGKPPAGKVIQVKAKDGTHIISIDADGNPVDHGAISGTAPSTRGVPNDPSIIDSSGNQVPNLYYRPPNTPQDAAHPLTRNDPGYVDGQGVYHTNPGYDPTSPATGTKGINRNDPAYLDAQGNLIPNPYYDPTASRPTGIPGTDPYIWDPNAEGGKGGMVKNPGYTPPNKQVERIGGKTYAFDPVTGALTDTGIADTQSQSIQDLATPSGGRDVIGIDPYSSKTSNLYHQPGEPRDMSHNIYLPSDWSGSYPTFDPAHPSQPGSAYHKGEVWNPPQQPPRTPQQASSPPPATPAADPAQSPASAPPAGTGVFAGQPSSDAGITGTAGDPMFGSDAGGPYPPGASSMGQPPMGPDWGAASVGDPSRGQPPDVGGGQDAPPAGSSGGMWRPPIDPSQVVGTGHKYGDQVSQEGVHKGVDLQATRGTETKSPVDGIVTKVEHNPQGLGITVTIRDAGGQEHTLGHLGSVSVKVGDRVHAGQPVAHVGSTGASTGPHLDYRVQGANGQHLDPTRQLGALAQMPRADDGSEPPAPDGGGATPPQAPPTGMGQDIPNWSAPKPVGLGQDVGVGGMRLANGSWSDALADTPDNQKKYGQGSGYQGGYGYSGATEQAASGGGGGGGTSGGGGGGGGSIQPNWYDQAYIQYLNDQLNKQDATARAQIQQQIDAENNRHNEAVKSEEEVARHNQELEKLQKYQADLSAATQSAIALLQSGTQIGIANAQIAAQFGLQSQQFKQQLATSALQNPWLQRLTGMAPSVGEVGGPGGQAWTPPGGQSFAQTVAGAENAPIPQVGGATTNAPGVAGSGAPGATAQTQSALPSWQDYSKWNPYQLSAWRTQEEAAAPGQFQSDLDKLRSSWAGQGVTDAPASSQLAWDTSTPEQQTQKGMLAETFGQTIPQWQQKQSTQWSKAAAPAVSAIT
jgi:murein DD-endopeptidase MepM/ murein hydrolase activator NlpD